MADYDVGVVSLTTPAPAAPLAQCRPVVSVRNNGIHDAVASGYIRIYAAGLKIYESEAYSDTIAPGETRPCSAVDYWTPPAEGPYTVQGYVTCPLDQVEPNNNLWPVTVNISGVVPPPPTPVALHASQHESGGEDEMSLEGLPGRAADEQTPINHASFHENGGIDRIDVTDLPGVLGEAQTPKSHAAAHKVGGSDQVDVLALPNATALELVARKGVANGYAPLDSAATVPTINLANTRQTPDSPSQALLFSHEWGYPIPSYHAASHEPGGADPIDFPGEFSDTGGVVGINGGGGETTLFESLLPDAASGAHLQAIIGAHVKSLQLATPHVWTFKLYVDDVCLATSIFSQAVSKAWSLRVQGHIIGVSPTGLRSSLLVTGADQDTVAIVRHSTQLNASVQPTGDFNIKLTCECTGHADNVASADDCYAYLPGGLAS